MFGRIIGNGLLCALGGDGVWTQLAEEDISSAVTVVDFTGLTWTPYDMLAFIIQHNEGSGNNCKVHLHVNGNTTDTDYHAQFLGSSGTSPSAALLNAPRIGETQANDAGLIWGGIVLVDDLWVYESKFTFASGSGIRNHSIHGLYANTVANITALRFEAQEADGFGVGSRLSLYGLKK